MLTLSLSLADVTSDSPDDAILQPRRSTRHSTRLNPSARPAVPSETTPSSRTGRNSPQASKTRTVWTHIQPGSRLACKKDQLADFYEWMWERNALFGRRYEDPEQ